MSEDNWDPRIDSNGRRASDPRFGKDDPSLIAFLAAVGAIALIAVLVALTGAK